jgi:hypothetical protein
MGREGLPYAAGRTGAFSCVRCTGKAVRGWINLPFRPLTCTLSPSRSDRRRLVAARWPQSILRWSITLITGRPLQSSGVLTSPVYRSALAPLHRFQSQRNNPAICRLRSAPRARLPRALASAAQSRRGPRCMWCVDGAAWAAIGAEMAWRAGCPWPGACWGVRPAAACRRLASAPVAPGTALRRAA